MTFDSPLGSREPRSLQQSRVPMAGRGRVAGLDAPPEKRPPVVVAR